jgi:hypothetical protein
MLFVYDSFSAVCRIHAKRSTSSSSVLQVLHHLESDDKQWLPPVVPYYQLRCHHSHPKNVGRVDVSAEIPVLMACEMGKTNIGNDIDRTFSENSTVKWNGS